MTKQISNCKFVLRIGQSYFALMTQFKIFEGKRQEEGGGQNGFSKLQTSKKKYSTQRLDQCFIVLTFLHNADILFNKLLNKLRERR